VTYANFRQYRLKQLIDFVRPRLGKAWRSRIRESGHRLNSHDGQESLERLALSLGFEDIPDGPFGVPLERNFLARLASVSRSVSAAPPIVCQLTFGDLLESFFRTRKHPARVFTDVLPIETPTKPGPSSRMLSPSLAKPDAAAVLAEVLTVVLWTTPGPLADSHGGHPGPHVRSDGSARNEKCLVSDYEI
jgi:hypothetical protein